MFWYVRITADGTLITGGGDGWSGCNLAYDETGKSKDVTISQKVTKSCYWKVTEKDPDKFPIGHPDGFSIVLQPMNGELREHFLVMSLDGLPVKQACGEAQTAWKMVLSKDDKHYLRFKKHD